ncbi:MAG: hypothetical protein H0W53_12420 [Acidobacteria bacterium]|nr:hypothetical protein [Acidobacteriota bacterium]
MLPEIIVEPGLLTVSDDRREVAAADHCLNLTLEFLSNLTSVRPHDIRNSPSVSLLR